MKKTVLSMVLMFGAAVFAATPESTGPVVLAPAQQQIQAAAMASSLLTRFHYTPMALDDAMSRKTFDRYIKVLDSDKVYFVQADVDQFMQARDKLDDAIKSQDLSAPYAMFNLYMQRQRQRLVYARALLSESFDFSKQEHYFYQRSDAAWAQSEAEVQDLWRQRVKNDWLRLKLAGKEDAAIRATLEKRYDYALANLKKLKSEDVFQIFMNAYAMSIEPHTNYLGPKAADDFDISMKLSLVGIGAVLQERDEMTVIRELVPGGPAARSGKLKVGDSIVGVAQANDKLPTDILGMRLDDVVRLIRGPEDSVVKLNILAADANPDAPQQLVPLVRKKITLDQQAAKKSIIDVKVGEQTRRVGVIALPTFYQDFDARKRGDKAFRSATRDVALLLEELKKERVDSVLMDLRNNGGGSLHEAIELSSLFIGSGPVVQQRDSRGIVRVETSSNAAIWDGAMGVLINRGSASASEIFAAAMQDYGRALIIGEPSFGKGTVQTIISLDAAAKSETPKFGEVKMTVAQFYRVNGGTTQLRGVTPDIQLPTFADTENGESSFDNALPWGQIKPANFQVLGNLADIVPILQKKHEQRIAKEPEFRFLNEDIAEFRLQKARKSVSLNEQDRRKERDAREAQRKHREALLQSAGGGVAKPGADRDTQDDGLQANERSLRAELEAEKASKVAKDIFQIEAASILADEVELIQTSTRLAQQVLSGFSRLKAQAPALSR